MSSSLCPLHPQLVQTVPLSYATHQCLPSSFPDQLKFYFFHKIRLKGSFSFELLLPFITRHAVLLVCSVVTGPETLPRLLATSVYLGHSIELNITNTHGLVNVQSLNASFVLLGVI